MNLSQAPLKKRKKKKKKKRGTSVKWGKGALVYLSLEGEKAVSPEKKKKKKKLVGNMETTYTFLKSSFALYYT